MSNQPRRSPAKFLKDAPAYLVALYDAGPQAPERYTALFGTPIWNPTMGNSVPSLAFGDEPGELRALGETKGVGRGGLFGKPMCWKELPQLLQEYVIACANHPKKVEVFTLEWGAPFASVEPCWQLAAVNRRPHPTAPGFGSRKEAREWARKENILLVD